MIRPRTWNECLRPRVSVVDVVAPRRPSVTLTSVGLVVARWLVVVIGALLASGSPYGFKDVVVGSPLALVALLRVLQVRHPGPDWLRALWPGLLAEVAIASAVVALSGGWHSSWMVAVMAQAALLGALVPSRWAGSAAAIGLIGLLLAGLILRSPSIIQSWLTSAVLLGAIGLTVAYATWVFARTERHRALLAEANQRLATTNALLVGLDRSSPRDGETFDPRRCARSIAATARVVLGAETIAVLTVTALPGRWQVLHAEGVHLATVIDDDEFSFLKAIGRRTFHESLTVPASITFGQDNAPLVAGSLSGMRIPLYMHDRLVGVLVLEHPTEDRWVTTDGSIIADLAERAALMLDNARRFNALWVVGATEERTRVAHDLHDHLGQSMAALGLELDILARRIEDPGVKATIRDLRGRVTFMVGDLRGTMRDLRCDVSETRDLTQVLGTMARDLDARSEATVEFESDGGGRMALAQEHQLLLVARQALTTAVVDARATKVRLRWSCDGDSGVLAVDHDGGIADIGDLGTLPAAAHLDALTGIEDRCRAIGARLQTGLDGSIYCEVSA